MKDRLDEMFSQRPEIPLFYVESGSRLWGISSPDSDFDVRGFHLLSKQQYFDFKKQRDLIEIMDGDFDFVSYDIDKMFGLLAKSNPTVFEWIRAHIVYMNNLPEWSTFQTDLIAHFDFKSLYNHYLSMTKSQFVLMEMGRQFTYKKTFYCIRGLLSANLASHGVVPALLINELFEQFETENELLKIAKESLARKRQQAEKEEVEATQRNYILSVIRSYMANLLENPPQMLHQREPLSRILTDYAFLIKEKYY